MLVIKQVYFCREVSYVYAQGRNLGDISNPLFPLQNGLPRSSAASCSISASLLGTKDVGIMKSQTGHQLFKVTQAPGWK